MLVNQLHITALTYLVTILQALHVNILDFSSTYLTLKDIIAVAKDKSRVGIINDKMKEYTL